MINILFLSANSLTYELKNNDCYYTRDYDLYLNDEFLFKSNKNVESIYELKPNTSYKLKINDEVIEFRTLNKKLIKFNKDYNDEDDTPHLQKAIDNLSTDEVLVLDDKYHVVSLFMKSNTSLYLTKNAILLGEVDRRKCPILKENEFLNGKPLGTWEGHADDSFASIITMLGVENVEIYGRGKIDCNAHNSDWWVNHREKRIARRPKGIFIHTSNNITLEGICVCNTPSWNQHPFYSTNLKYLNMSLVNPWDSPTTDGCDPESCKNVYIIGNFISVGDDCIAIKSGRVEFAKLYHTPCENIIIRNNFMNHGHAGVTLGSENSGGINDVFVTNCIFNDTDRGLRIKSQRGRGKDAIIKDVIFDNIKMDHVKSPFVINAFYKAGTDVLDAKFDRTYHTPDESTPSLKSFRFDNIECKNVCYGVGYFLGLPESKIESILLNNVTITYDKTSKPGEMAMNGTKEVHKNAMFVCENVKNIILNNVVFIDKPEEDNILINVDSYTVL